MHLFFIIVAAILVANWLKPSDKPSDSERFGWPIIANWPSAPSEKPSRFGWWPILIPIGAAIFGILLMSLT